MGESKAAAPAWSCERPLHTLSRALGFRHRSNLQYFLACASFALLFILFRGHYMLVETFFCNPANFGALPGECYWYTMAYSRYYIGIRLHLWSVFPASLIAVGQFIPRVRQQYPRYHRLAGRVCMVLGLTAGFSSFLIFDQAFGGTTSTAVGSVTIAILSITGHYKAWMSIRNHRIDIHRAWMLRTWAWMGSIVTMRPIIAVVALGVSMTNKRSLYGSSWYGTIALPCEQILYMLSIGTHVGTAWKPDFFATYGAQCMSPKTLTIATSLSSAMTNATLQVTGGRTIPMSVPAAAYALLEPGAKALISADLTSIRLDEQSAALDIGFGPAVLLSITIHAILVEIYLYRTKDEATRLRKISEARIAAKKRVDEGIDSRVAGSEKGYRKDAKKDR